MRLITHFLYSMGMAAISMLGWDSRRRLGAHSCHGRPRELLTAYIHIRRCECACLRSGGGIVKTAKAKAGSHRKAWFYKYVPLRESLERGRKV